MAEADKALAAAAPPSGGGGRSRWWGGGGWSRSPSDTSEGGGAPAVAGRNASPARPGNGGLPLRTLLLRLDDDEEETIESAEELPDEPESDPAR